MEWLRRLLRWISGLMGAPSAPSSPGRPSRQFDEFLAPFQHQPGLRSTTTRILGGKATDDNVLFRRQRLEVTDPDGNALQLDAFDARTCGFGHVLSESCLPAGRCLSCGELVCSTQGPVPCCGVCSSCGAVCCVRDRRTRNLGQGRQVTYCKKCAWHFWSW